VSFRSELLRLQERDSVLGRKDKVNQEVCQ
jgi:hypothetical protein